MKILLQVLFCALLVIPAAGQVPLVRMRADTVLVSKVAQSDSAGFAVNADTLKILSQLKEVARFRPDSVFVLHKAIIVVTSSGDTLFFVRPTGGVNFEDSVRIGAGTTVATNPLSVTGNADISGTLTVPAISSATAITLTPTTDVFIANGKGVVVGHTAQLVSSASITPEFQVTGTDGLTDGAMGLHAFTTGNGPRIVISRSAGASVGTYTNLATNDDIGIITFSVANNTSGDFRQSAAIQANADATHGNNDYPSRLTFLTVADGDNGLTERMRIDSAGRLGVGTSTLSYPFNFHGSNTGTHTEMRNTSATTPNGLYINFPSADNDDNSNFAWRFDSSAGMKAVCWSDGDIVNHDGTYGTISDSTRKQDIADADRAWSRVKALKFRQYRMKDDVANGDFEMRYGTVAQEVQQVFPEFVHEMQNMQKVVDGRDTSVVLDNGNTVTMAQYRERSGEGLAAPVDTTVTERTHEEPDGTVTLWVDDMGMLKRTVSVLPELMARLEALEAKVNRHQTTIDSLKALHVR